MLGIYGTAIFPRVASERDVCLFNLALPSVVSWFARALGVDTMVIV